MKFKKNIILFSLILAFTFPYCARPQGSVGIHWLHQENSPLGNFPDGPWVDVRPYVRLESAISAVGTNEVTLLISEPIEICIEPTDTLAIPSNISLQFLRGGSLTLKGEMVNILGAIEAGLWQIFQGNGRVIFKEGPLTNVCTVYPQWWGAMGDGSTDDTKAIQKAINAIHRGHQ